MLEKDRKPKGPRFTPVSIYEEKLLLKRLEACPGAVAMTPEARRLKRKLIVRQAKRDRGLPLFDLDQVVNAALLLVDGIYGAKEGVSRLPAGQAMYRTTCQDFRILDRYQVSVGLALQLLGPQLQGARGHVEENSKGERYNKTCYESLSANSPLGSLHTHEIAQRVASIVSCNLPNALERPIRLSLFCRSEN